MVSLVKTEQARWLDNASYGNVWVIKHKKSIVKACGELTSEAIEEELVL